MARWFHRNPLKATSPVGYELKRILTSPDSGKICSDLRLCRTNLLEYLRDANHDLTTVEEEFNKYLSLIFGFCYGYNEKNGESKLRMLVEYKWTMSMLGSTPVELNDSWFEVVNMIVNMALWYMKHAAKIAGKDEVNENEAKIIHKCLRKAAGLFSYVQQEKSRFGQDLTVADAKGSDFDQQVLNAYILQCTAEAQEVTVARAIELGHNAGLISALANETAKLFQQAGESLQTQDPILYDKWRKYCQLKAQFYLGYAYCYCAKKLLSDDKCGEAIRAAKEGYKCLDSAEKLCADYSKSKGVGQSARVEAHLFFRQLKSKLKLILEQCERENSLIYHQKVAEECPQLEIKATHGLVKPDDFQFLTPNPLWTDKSYQSFDINKGNMPSFGSIISALFNLKSKKVEKELPAVKEEPMYQTDKDPKNESGCVIS